MELYGLQVFIQVLFVDDSNWKSRWVHELIEKQIVGTCLTCIESATGKEIIWVVPQDEWIYV